MLEWLLGTLTTAFPFIVPVIVLMVAQFTGYRWSAQRYFTYLALALYGFSLIAFGIHATGTDDVLNEWFRAFYGTPYEKTTWCLLGFWAQGLAAVSILFAVNWRVIRLFYGEDINAPANLDEQMKKFREVRQNESHRD